MAKNSVRSVLKKCRQLDIDPTHVGVSKKSNKSFSRRGRKLSEYGVQLREKQRVKFIYNVNNERQFRKYFDLARKQDGITGENLLRILESRLDNVVFRLGFARTRRQARQFVVHGNFEVNGQKVDIPSYLLKEGDLIALREIRKDHKIIKENMEDEHKATVPSWLELDEKKIEGKIVKLPTREEIDLPVEEHLIVELYSK